MILLPSNASARSAGGSTRVIGTGADAAEVAGPAIVATVTVYGVPRSRPYMLNGVVVAGLPPCPSMFCVATIAGLAAVSVAGLALVAQRRWPSASGVPR